MPEGETAAPPASPAVTMVRSVSLCSLYILLSAGLINFNKYLMNRHRFPHAMALTWMHMLCSWVMCIALYAAKPTLFPSMSIARQAGVLNVLKWFVPLGFLFAIALYTSNQAYLYCSVAFLQFMKEANVVLVFALSCMIGLQVADRARMVVVVWIIAGAAMAVEGEVRFVMIGFLVQAISQLAECSKNVMGEHILSGSGLRLDPLTYTMFMAPVCLVALTFGNVVAWNEQLLPRAMECWQLLLPNACLAFILNVTIATLIKECSAMGFILSGLVKDMFIVSASSVLFGETITGQQFSGFSLCLAGIFFWSYMKVAPQSASVVWLRTLTGCREESAPLLQKQPDKKGIANDAKV